MSVTLNRLYIDATSIKNLPNGRRVFFALTYIDPDIVTLSGWPATPGGPFDPDPAIVLRKVSSVIIPVNPVYVGNVVLDIPGVVDAKRIIAQTGATFVLFDPEPSTDYPNHVHYVMGFTKEDPTVKTNPAIIEIETLATTTLNPSPPKSL
jgi:hypothetical protein